VSRFHLSPDAEGDLDEIVAYVDQFPLQVGDRIRESLQTMLHIIGRQPYLGLQDSYLTRLIGEEVRSRARLPISYLLPHRQDGS
jgi:plasmid stabilization system protein ParE